MKTKNAERQELFQTRQSAAGGPEKAEADKGAARQEVVLRRRGLCVSKPAILRGVPRATATLS
jgi:hypothetical protein